MVESQALPERGWSALGPVLTPDRVAGLQRAFDMLIDADVKRARYPDRATCLKICQRWPGVWRRHEAFAALLLDPSIRALAGGLLGLGSVRLLFMDVVVKSPWSTLHVPWHQDLPHWAIAVAPEREDPAGVLLWVALDDVEPATGGLRYLRGGHRSLSPPQAEVDVVGAMRAGDVLAHDPRAWHASGPNRTDRWRRACLIAFADPSLPRKDGQAWNIGQNPAG